jgi:TatD DNase family protein
VRLVDSHCHLQADRFAADVPAVVAAARAAGVERILVPGWNLRSSRDALELAARIGGLDVAVGIHPHDASSADGPTWREIERLAGAPAVVAIGETGLDYDRVFSPVDAQLANLRRHLGLARDLGHPVVLHCRSAPGRHDAQDALLRELDEARTRAAVIHSYSGPLEYGREVIARGYAVSFSGLVFRRAEEASAAVAALVPGDRLLVETDSPYLSPPGAPRRRNEPEWVRVTAAWVAERRGESAEALGESLIRAYDLSMRPHRLTQGMAGANGVPGVR